MGCGGSKSIPVPAETDVFIPGINVPDTEDGYPLPKPPRDRKEKVYREEDCKALDENAKSAPKSINKDYNTLVMYITKDAKNDVEKVRCLFAWLGVQKIENQTYKNITDANCPEGYMKTIQQGNGSYPAFFALLCRAASLPCVILRGACKAAGYEVGQQDVFRLRSAWNAVYVDGQWRFVHPLWAFTGVVGFNTGAWTKVEQSGQAVREQQKASGGMHVYSFDENYFLPDPDHYIYMCRADKPEWQLLKTPWSMEKFANVPQFEWAYFDSGLKLVSEHAAILKCKKAGDVNFEHPNTLKVNLDYALFFDEEKSEDRLPDGLQLDRYVIEVVDQNHQGLRVRFPVRGIYKLEISLVNGYAKSGIVSFRLDNSQVTANAQPFPINPKIGFGYGQKAEDAGLSKPSQVKGIMIVRQGERIKFHFKVTRRLDVQALLVHKDLPSTELAHHVTQDQSAESITIGVVVPEHAQNPEYALQVNVRPEGTSGEFENVANYLLTHGKDTVVSSEDSDNIRSQMVAATDARDMNGLEKTIPQFERSRLPDMGDLTRARKTLIDLHEKALRDATKQRDLDKLEAAIKAAKESCVAIHLQGRESLTDAEAVRNLLRRLKLYLHKILELKPATVSEIHSYQHPLPLVHIVMQATYLLLGEKQGPLKKWERIQALLRKTGREGIIRRIKEFDMMHLKKSIMTQAENSLDKCSKDEVRLVSAGAGTFYVWSENIIREGKNDENGDGKEDKDKEGGRNRKDKKRN